MSYHDLDALNPKLFHHGRSSDFPGFDFLPISALQTVEFELVKSQIGITAAGTVPDFHRIPF
jgi:hypothetical protein